MNTKGIKFLAVLAVLAMAFAAFAVVGYDNGSDAVAPVEPITTGEKGETYAISFTDANLKYASGAVTGTTVNNANETSAFTPKDNSYIPFGMGTITVANVEAMSTAKYVKITQENSAWKYVGLEDTTINNDKMVREKSYEIGAVFSATEDVLDFLIPTDGSVVKFTFAYYATTSAPKSTDTPISTTSFSVDFSDAYTIMTLGANATKGIGFEYDGSVLTLNNYAGNAVFQGPISQITLSGDNKIAAKGVPVAIKSTENLKIKPVEGTGSLDIVLDDSAMAVIGIESEKKLTIEGSNITVKIDSVDETTTAVSGILSAEDLSIYESTINIDLDANKLSVGINSTNGGIEIKSSKTIEITAGFGMKAEKGNIDVAATSITAESSIAGIGTQELTVTKNSIINASANIQIPDDAYLSVGMIVEKLTVESESEITVDNLRIEPVTDTPSAKTSVNNATVNVTEDLIIGDLYTVVNKSVFNVDGKTLIIGTLENQGTFTAAGDVTLSKFKNELVATTVVIDGLTKIQGTTEYFVKTVKINAMELNADNTAYISDADIVFALCNTPATEVTKEEVSGTATLDSNGKITGFSFIVKSDDGATPATEYQTVISATWQSYTEDSATKYKYVVDANGQYYSTEALTIVPSQTETPGTSSTGNVLLLASGTGVFTATAGTFTAQGAFNVDSVQANLVNGGELNANVTAKAPVTLTKGTLAGNVGAAADDSNIQINKDAILNGNVDVAKASNVTIDGTLTGNVSSSDKAVVLTIDGKMTGDFSISGKYKSSTSATSADTDYKTVISLAINGKEGVNTIINAVAASGTTAGFIDITKAGTPASNKTSGVVVKEGEFQFSATMTIPAGFDFTADVGSTVSIKSAMTVTITGAIVIKEGATFNVYDSEKKVYSYGKIDNEITFTVSPNTYYCSFTYALGNAPEGTPLEVSKDVTINSDISVKKDVLITIAAGKTVAFGTYALAMAEGSEFILSDGSKITFEITPENKKISGIFSYFGNEFSLTDVVFTAAGNIISAVKASGSVTEDRIQFNNTGYNSGAVELIEGQFTGSIVFIDKGDAGKETTGTITIDADATYVGTFASDTARKAVINNNGNYAPSADVLGINIAWDGTGTITLADGKKVGFAAYDAKKIKQNAKVVYGDNTVTLEGAYFDAAVTFEAVKATSSVPANIAVNDFAAGEQIFGKIGVTGNLVLGKGDLDKSAVITAEKDSTISITNGKEFIATGLIKTAGTINMKTEEVTTYGTLTYDFTYVDGDYTVYAKMASAVAKAPSGTTFTIDKEVNVDTIELNNGNTITITGDGVLNVANWAIVGTPAKTLGASDAIIGKVVLGPGAYAIVYNNGDASEAKFVDNTNKAALVSNYSINNVTYCDIYATAGVAFATVQGTMGNPSIEGYKFQGWEPYVEGATTIGASDVFAKTASVQFKVTLTSVNGAIYKVGGKTDVVLDSPFYVDFGTVINAVAASGYAGNTQSWTVDKDMTITASGFTPVQPEPTPEPSSSSDFGVTEILLIVLVVLCAVLVIVIILKLNRN